MAIPPRIPQSNIRPRGQRRVSVPKSNFASLSREQQDKIAGGLLKVEGFGLKNGDPIVQFGSNHPQRGQEEALIRRKIRAQLLGKGGTLRTRRGQGISTDDSGFFNDVVKPQASANTQRVLQQLLGR